MSDAREVILEADAVTQTRGSRRAIDSVSVRFGSGEWTAVVGPNGAGKSTLLSLLAGLSRPCEGSVRLAGRGISAWSDRERAQRLVWLAQTTTAEGDIAARDLVRLGRLPEYGLFGTPTTTDETAVDLALAETDATGFSHRRIGELSGGERQRVLLARVFAAQAPILLLDEPTVHLDAPHQRALIRSLRARARAGVTAVTVLHDLTLALAADRLIVLASGHLKADGSPNDAGVREELIRVFGGAISIEQLGKPGEPRWAAVPIF